MRLSGRVYRSTWNSPSVLWSVMIFLSGKSRKHTFNVILGIRVWRFIVVYHLHDLEKVIFSKALESVCQLVHVDLHTFVRPRSPGSRDPEARDGGIHSSPCASSSSTPRPLPPHASTSYHSRRQEPVPFRGG